jgi:pimeloyl-ACP methyl ester carboxylesterase
MSARSAAEGTASGGRRFLEVGGLRLAYRPRGPAGKATPLVILHGWGASLDAVAAAQQVLSDDRQTFAFDLPGFGQSGAPPPAWGSPEYAACLRQALAALGLERVALLGHSFGGKLAVHLAVGWPELVEHLVLVNAAGIRLPDSAAVRARRAGYRLGRRLLGRGRLAERLLGRLGSADYWQAGALRPILVRVVNEDLRPLLPRVGVPTLLIWGDRDRETPLAGGAIMEREIPDAGLVVFPGAGHFSYADDLPRFARVVGNFLKA